MARLQQTMENNLIKKKRRNVVLLLVGYTVLFAVIFAGVYYWFYEQGKSFINEYDALDQGYFWTVELKNNLSSLLAGNGFPGWSWSRGAGMDLKGITDPFMVFAALFPLSKIDLGYTLAVVLRMYCSGLAFIAFAKGVKLNNYPALLGAICYVFSSWVIDVSLIQAQFVNVTVIFPLVILGVDRIYQRKSPAIFMLAVAWAMINSVYLGYMVGICTVMYIVLRYFAYCEKFSIKEYVLWILKFIAFGLIGIAASIVLTITTIGSLMGASTGGSAVTYDTFKGTDFLLNLGNTFISEGFSFTYGWIGLPIVGLMVIAVSYRYFSIRNTHLFMTGILIIMMMFPFFSSMFNGFGYVTTRWYFLLIFFLAWTAAESFDLDKLAKWQNLIILVLWMGVIIGSTFGFAYLDITENYSHDAFEFIKFNLMAGLVILVIIALGIKNLVPLRVRQVAIILVVAAVIPYTWYNSFSNYSSTEYMNLGQMQEMLSTSTQRVGNQIQDDGFYRIDQIDGINIHNKADQPANENLYWQTRTLYLYDSKIPTKLQEFNRLMGNTYSYSKRVYVLSNNNRSALDFIYGVKYFLGNDTVNGITESDGSAGYGFSRIDDIDGVHVFKNKYDSGLGFEYDKVISRTEFEKLSRLEREQAILQAMVVDDEYIAGVDPANVVTASDIKIDITDIPYKFGATDGATVNGNTITVDKEEAYVDIVVSDVSKSQLMVSLDNFIKVNAKGVDIGDFYFSAKTDKKKSGANNKKNNQTIAGIKDYDLNLGYYDSYSGNIRIRFAQPGTYTFDKLYVSAMSAANYDKFAGKRLEGKFEVEAFSDSEVIGSIDAMTDGYVFFSIPSNENWEAYVDGVHTAKVKDANIAFMAVPVDEGSHQIVLKHSMKHKTIALAISLGAVLLIIAIEVVRRLLSRKRGKHEKSNNLRNI